MMISDRFLVEMTVGQGKPNQDDVETWLGYDGITMADRPEAPALGLYNDVRRTLDYDQAAIANFTAVNRRAGQEIARLRIDVMPKLMRSQAPRDRKFIRIQEIADKANALVAPSTPCHNGCAHCCHIAVAVSYSEAYTIGLYTGISPRAQSGTAGDALTMRRLDSNMGRYSGKRCTFLGQFNECTIYPVRPIACRTHHVIGPNASRCDVSRGPQDIHSLNLQFIHNAMAGLTKDTEAWADIRDYFPNSGVTLEPQSGANFPDSAGTRPPQSEADFPDSPRSGGSHG